MPQAKQARTECGMCDQCKDLDQRIEHYQRISASMTDETIIDRIKELIAKIKAQKAELHPELKA
jgi:hypothetical protein